MGDSNGVVAAVVQPFYDAINNRDREAMAALFAESDALFVGPGVDEWWTGPEGIDEGLGAQLELLPPGVEIAQEKPVVAVAGDVAWFADRPLIRLPDGSSAHPRLTGVAVRSGGGWRIVQGHISREAAE